LFATPPRRATTLENGSNRRQPRSQGRKEEGAETLILERDYSTPRVSI